MNVTEDEVWWLTADQMGEVDRLTIDRLGVDLTRMMENAGRSLAELAELAISMGHTSPMVEGMAVAASSRPATWPIGGCPSRSSWPCPTR